MNVLIFGATSTIAQHLSRQFAQNSAHLLLLARDLARLEATRTDLLARGAKGVMVSAFDALDAGTFDGHIDEAWQKLGNVDVAVICHGSLTERGKAESSASYAARELAINGSSAAALMAVLAARLANQGGGRLVVLGSVAGDRGRPSNYLYGAAKSAVEVCAEGLDARFAGQRVSVLTVKPGFVRTAMTADLDLPAALTTTPESVARTIHRAISRSKSGVIYTPWFWRWIMLIIRLIPKPIFKRLSL